MGTPIVGDVLSIMLKNPFLAYFIVLSALALDSWVASFPFSLGGIIGGEGLAGTIVTTVLNTFNVPITVTSFQIMFIVAVVPVIIFVLKKSGHR